MPPLPLRAFTQQLRDRWPNEAKALRLRRATRNGKNQYQLIGELPDRTPIGRKLRATTEFDALQEAIDLVPALMNGDGNRGRVMPMGRLKAIERLALQELERKGFIRIKRLGQGRANLYELNLKAKVLKQPK